MMLTVFIALGTIVGSLAGKCSLPKGAVPQWSPSYSARGAIHIPYAELKEPFIVWYDAETSTSRIDYYGGMVKTYQLSQIGPYGTMRKIVPLTNDYQLNVPTCLEVNGTSDSQVPPQSVLPDLSNFKCKGKEVLNGLECEIWTYTDKEGDKVSQYAMWLRWKKISPLKPAIPVPVQYEMKGYNSLLGSHYDHYYLTYDMFTPEAPSPDIFEVDADSCTHMPGPGIQHIATFNPLREFIHREYKHIDYAFDEFKIKHNKEYKHQHEHRRRKEIFKQNFRFINSKNRANLGFQLSVNHLADRTDEELAALRGRKHTPGYNGGSPFPYTSQELSSLRNDIPSQYDWRLYGAVTPVKDQSVCGSCWSFGTTGAVEGAYFVKTGHLLRLSQQALIDCSWGEGNNGCDGGEDYRSYRWMMKSGGLPLEAEYGGYLGQDGLCHVKETKLTARITGYVNVTSGDEDALRVAIFKHGPISVSIDAGHKTFSFYSNGVYYDPECKNRVDQLDHSVLAVGYGMLNGKKYWLVKNSWSNLWGNDGYILMSSQDNNCGVTTQPTYVTM